MRASKESPRGRTSARQMGAQFRILLVVLLSIGIVIFGFIAFVVIESRVVNSIDAYKERSFIACLQKGMTRSKAYDCAKHLGLKLTNSDFITWHDATDPSGKAIDETQERVGHSYVPASDGAFPEPNAKYPHPDVGISFDKPGGLLTWPYDEINVYFDNHDKISKWKVFTATTGV